MIACATPFGVWGLGLIVLCLVLTSSGGLWLPGLYALTSLEFGVYLAL